MFIATQLPSIRDLSRIYIPEVCLTDPLAPFTDTSSVVGGTIVAWEWNFGDPNANAGNPNTSVLQNPTHWYTVVGPYTSAADCNQ
ncbi:MAG: hypothetical protein IPK57_05670 [Chitinophagaceae bacterium]|nr:hypothetical protein [Chitinophagaceae bacterium]